MSSRPEILVLVNHYLPGYRAGGPVRSIANMVYWLGDDINFKILTDNYDLGETQTYPDVQPGIWYPVGKAQVRYLSRKEQNLINLGKLLNETNNYDALYLNGIFATLTIKSIVLHRSRRLPRKAVLVAPRGQLHSSALAIKARKKTMFLKAARHLGLYDQVIWHASNPIEKEHIEREFPDADIVTLPNMPAPVDQAQGKIYSRPKRAGKVRLIFLGRIARVKNLHFALNQLNSLTGQITFNIYGPLEDKVYWQECLAIIHKLPPNIEANYKGELEFEQVAHTLSVHHLLVLPTLGENFGHAIFDALAASCPVLISDQTPWNSVNENGAGWALPLNQPHLFQTVLQDIVDMEDAAFQKLADQAYQLAARYSQNEELVKQTKQLFYSLFGSQ